MSRQPVENHFVEMLDMVLMGSGAVVGEETGGRKQ